MAKPLRAITGKDKKLEGSNASVTRPGSTGKNPGVDYDPKAPADQEFVKDHTTQVFADRVGNKDVPYTAPTIKQAILKPGEGRHGNTPKEAELKYKKTNEEVGCNYTPEGTACPTHEMAACPSSEPKDKVKSLKKVLLDKKIKEENLDEKLSKSMTAGDIISDFVNSKDPKFAGKSKEERKKMALGAYYSMHPEKSRNEEVEELDELSRKKLMKYKGDSLSDEAKRITSTEPFGSGKKDAEYERKLKNRSAGRKLAHDKTFNIGGKKAKVSGTGTLGETEQIDELELKTYMNYTNKAMKQTREKEKKPGEHFKRSEGIHRAARLYLKKKAKEKVQEDLAMPMLEGGKKKKKTSKESAPSDTPIRFPSGNVGDTGRV